VTIITKPVTSHHGLAYYTLRTLSVQLRRNFTWRSANCCCYSCFYVNSVKADLCDRSF